jgi:hypothetical protein
LRTVAAGGPRPFIPGTLWSHRSAGPDRFGPGGLRARNPPVPKIHGDEDLWPWRTPAPKDRGARSLWVLSPSRLEGHGTEGLRDRRLLVPETHGDEAIRGRGAMDPKFRRSEALGSHRSWEPWLVVHDHGIEQGAWCRRRGDCRAHPVDSALANDSNVWTFPAHHAAASPASVRPRNGTPGFCDCARVGPCACITPPGPGKDTIKD